MRFYTILMAEDYHRLKTLVTQNLFLTPESKEQILRDWEDFNPKTKKDLYHKLEIAYQKQMKAFEAAMHHNPHFLSEARMAEGEARKEKLKVIEAQAFQESESDSEAILSELNDLES